MKTQILLDHEKVSDGAAHLVRVLLRIEGDAPPAEERVPLNLSLVLDRSGSMSGAKLERAKEAAVLLARRLWPEDVVSVVAYDDVVQVIAEPATGPERQNLAAEIGAIRTGGSTNLSGGWLRGRELVAGQRRDGAANRVILLTDGLANVGITDPDRLAGLCRAALAQGVTTTTIGFGQDYDEVLLRRMAEAGGGATYYIERPDQAPAVFAEEVGGLLSLCAQNLAVALQPAPAAQLALVHHGYPRSEIEGGIRLELGDVYAAEPRLLLAEFLVTADAPDADVAIAVLTLTADVLTADGGVERQEIRLPVRASLATGPHVEPELRRELLLQEAARARAEARDAQERGDYDGASACLDLACHDLMAYDDADPELAEEAEDLRRMAERFREGSVDAADAKYLHQRGYAIANDRKRARDVISRVRREKGDEEGGAEGGTRRTGAEGEGASTAPTD